MDGMKLRNLRSLYRLSLEEVGKFSGLTKSTLSKFERGKCGLLPQTQQRLIWGIDKAVEHSQKIDALEQALSNKLANEILAFAIDRWISEH